MDYIEKLVEDLNACDRNIVWKDSSDKHDLTPSITFNAGDTEGGYNLVQLFAFEKKEQAELEQLDIYGIDFTKHGDLVCSKWHGNSRQEAIQKAVELAQDLIRGRRKEMNKFNSYVDLTDKGVLYLCKWNDSILEIHNEETLKDTYSNTNLFTDPDGIFHNFDLLNQVSVENDLTLKNYLELSQSNENYLSKEFVCDNMQITRIS